MEDGAGVSGAAVVGVTPKESRKCAERQFGVLFRAY